MIVCICGINGKMGKKIYNRLKDEHKIIGIDKIKEEGFIYDDYIKCLDENKIDVLVDFSNSDYSYNVIKYFLSNKIKTITGTTNFEKNKLKELLILSKKNQTSFITSYNYSLGINHLFKYIKELKKDYPNISIEEAHHIDKHDRPSGSAKMIADILKTNYLDVTILRKTNQNAFHEVSFFNDFEKITITHEVLDYNVFIEGFMKYFKIISEEKYIVKQLK